jgi:hypothetical protein
MTLRSTAGIAWAIACKHDRPWFATGFGQGRYMSLASTGGKFDSTRYAEHVSQLERANV